MQSDQAGTLSAIAGDLKPRGFYDLGPVKKTNVWSQCVQANVSLQCGLKHYCSSSAEIRLHMLPLFSRAANAHVHISKRVVRRREEARSASE